MKTGNRTPYEIRLELLQLAQVILSEKHKAAAVEYALSHYDTLGHVSPTTFPTTEEIIAEADKMNGFISKGSV